MGYDIALVWDTAAADPVARNRRLADALLAEVPGLSELPLDPAAIARSLGVPVGEVWAHWSQVELNLPGTLLGGQLDLWLDRAYLTLPSDPPAGCAAALEVVGPLLSALARRGLRVAEPAALLRECEAQRARVLRVAELVGGETPNQALQRTAGASRPSEL